MIGGKKITEISGASNVLKEDPAIIRDLVLGSLRMPTVFAETIVVSFKGEFLNIGDSCLPCPKSSKENLLFLVAVEGGVKG